MTPRNAPFLAAGALASATLLLALQATAAPRDPLEARIETRVEALLSRMTLEEEAGQLNQYNSGRATGPGGQPVDLGAEIRAGRVGSLLNVMGAAATRHYQEFAAQSRLRIPLLFGHDVIHGYRTIFPIPLAQAASWDLDAIRGAERIAATEAAAAGIHWTFAPMVDIARDPRWGRVMEGAGEDAWLGSRIAAARVAGFQGEGLGRLDTVMATAKHYAAYGAAIGGRDYNSVDMSERTLREVYLPPFHAAAEAGAATFMNSFNTLDGIPATANAHLLRDILKGEWQFKGFVVSDWGSIGELIPHGVAKDHAQAAEIAIKAGSDMDMEGDAYADNLPALVRSGRVPKALVDDAVRRVLRMKFRLGLFDDPYRYSDPQREQRELADPAHAQAARALARESIVLLRNEGGVLPLAPAPGRIAWIGPLARATTDNLGAWSVELPGIDYRATITSAYDALARRLPAGAQLSYAEGCDVRCESREGFAAAIDAARAADVVLLSVGEDRGMTGEARSHANLHLPGLQEELVRAIVATGKPVVMIVGAGRPLVFEWSAGHVPAILYTWWLGTEAGEAIADVLLGDYNPSGKLTISFPRTEGQIPVYYDHLGTGRPETQASNHEYFSGYVDIDNAPLYAFGHGLSYTSFGYGELALDRHEMRAGQAVTVSARVTNTGKRTGTEVVQLYVHRPVASVAQPLLQLRGFERVTLKPGESRELRFRLDAGDLSFHDARMHWGAEPGEVEVMLGSSSADIRLRDRFQVVP